MEESNKLPLKRVELPLEKFNEVAIPHHLDLLRQHKANIIKYEEAGQYARVHTEQMHARRVASQLRVLLGELDALRRQVRAQDVTKFDQLTQRSRDLTLRAIMDYLDSSPVSIPSACEAATAGSAVSTDSVGVLPLELASEQIQLQVDDQELQLRSREAALRGWRALQAELRALHDAWQHVQAAALAQRDQVNAVAASVDEGAENVEVARSDLASSERLRAGAWGAGGALAGAMAGGPAGLVLGAKLGALAALAGSALGFAAARLLARARQRQIQGEGEEKKQL